MSRLCRDKCAFCEREVRRSDGSVHHFRPLGQATGRSEEAGASLEHYAWLAYDWENLLLVCQRCDKAKGSAFPVAGERAVPNSSYDEVLAVERAELVDPRRDEPSRHLRFPANGDCVALDRVGEMTIAVLDLASPDLVEARERDLADLPGRLARSVQDARFSELDVLFDLDREFVGIRLAFLHRVLRRWKGLRLTGNRSSAMRSLKARLSEATDQERTELAGVCVELGTEESLLPLHRSSEQPVASAHEAPVSRPPRIGLRTPPPSRRIASIEIRDFKSLDAIRIELPVRREADPGPPCVMLLGENAVGKSTVLEAVAGALAGVGSIRRLDIAPSEFIRRDDPEMWNVLEHRDAFVEVTFHDDDHRAVMHVDGIGRRYRGTDGPSALVLAYGARRRFAKRERGAGRSVADHVVPLFRVDRPLSPPEDWLRSLSAHPAVFDAVARALRIVLALDDEDELTVDAAGRMCVMSLGRPVPVEKLSEGYRSLLGLVADIVRNLLLYWPDLERAQAIVLIDELETHLHPRWKMRVMSAFREALPGVQFIVTTHDPLCLRGMDDGEVHVLEKDRDGRVHQLTELPGVRGMSAEQLLTSEYFGLWSTADPELEYHLARSDDMGLSETEGDTALVRRLVLGDTVREQLIHEALDRYLASRRARRFTRFGRRDAVEAVLDVLRKGDAPEGDDA
ncbi:AAA family ATPase [Sphingomonas panni]|uniref:AAA family ATPase n=1 Tax=Sphingomonas panni TaxID=237612 RepID=UPI001F5B9B4D|nr:AAA family ATPase [Sphingomonas panni]